MARKTREESLNTKNRILDAAELVLLEKGVGQTAMADIAEAAGMSRGAVYGHFNGKIEVCVAVCDRAFSRAVEGFDLSDERRVAKRDDVRGRRAPRRCALRVPGDREREARERRRDGRRERQAERQQEALP